MQLAIADCDALEHDRRRLRSRRGPLLDEPGHAGVRHRRRGVVPLTEESLTFVVAKDVKFLQGRTWIGQDLFDQTQQPAPVLVQLSHVVQRRIRIQVEAQIGVSSAIVHEYH